VAPTDAFRLYETCRNELGHPQKGAIAVGSDADIIVFDPAASKTISAATQKYVIYYNVLEGFSVTGRPRVRYRAARHFGGRTVASRSLDMGGI